MKIIGLKDFEGIKVKTKSEKKKSELYIERRENNKIFLLLGDEEIEIADFKVQISAKGVAEVYITFKGILKFASILVDMDVHYCTFYNT